MSELARLFAMDPLELAKSEKDLDALIEVLREKRSQFISGNKSGGRTSTPKLTENQAKHAGLANKLDIKL